MKFFIDTANLDQIKEAQGLGVLDGVTTNPSLMAKEGITGRENILKHYLDICEAVEGDVSAEVISAACNGGWSESKRLGRNAFEISRKRVKTIDSLSPRTSPVRQTNDHYIR